MNKYNIIYNLLQAFKKHKTKLILRKLNKNNILLLEFLWQNHFIYGFFNLGKTIGRAHIIFLKYNQIPNFWIKKKMNKKMNKKKLLKEQQWCKNSFFIIKTLYGLKSIKTAISHKIGGFLLHKIY